MPQYGSVNPRRSPNPTPDASTGGTPVPLIQLSMGHADIATTPGYIHIRPGDSRAMHLPRV